MLVTTLIRAISAWLLLSLRDIWAPGPRLHWPIELGLALLLAGGEFLVIDTVDIPLARAGRAVQAGLVALTIFLIGLHHSAPWLSAHTLIATSILLATGVALSEGIFPRQPANLRT